MQIKKIVPIIIFLLVFGRPILATNTYTTDLEDSASEEQSWSIADGDSTGIDFTSDFTVEYWIKQETDIGSTQYNKWNATGNQRSFAVVYSNANSGQFTIYTSDAGSGAKADTVTDFNIGTSWHHLAFVYDASAGTVKAYKDGNTTAVGTFTGLDTSLKNSSAPTRIGAGANNGSTVDGQIDDFRLWSVARTANQISAHYNCEIDTSTTSLEAYWKFDNNGNDATSNNNNLTNNNSATFQSGDLPFTDACYGSATADPCSPTAGSDYYQTQDCTYTSDVYHDSRWIMKGGSPILKLNGRIIIKQ